MAAANPKSNLSKYQRFEIATINRRDIKKAEYNPRVLDEQARKMLRRSLKANGLVETLVWNKRTGNLVGGHQRITTLDDLEGRDDYDLTVAVVDVDEHTEKKLNLALNNRNIQGEWDDGLLADILRDCSDTDLKDIGVTEFDLEILLNEGSEAAAAFSDSPERAATKTALADIKQDRAAMNERLKEENSAGFYTTILFETQAAREELHRLLGQPLHAKYIAAGVVKACLLRAEE